jgi:hemerythrin
MSIKIGKYRLTLGPKDFEISESKIINTGKEKGKETLTDKQYFSSLESALNNVLKRHILKSDATTLVGLLNELKAYRTEMQELFKETI